MPLDIVAGLQVAIANVAQVAQIGVGEDVWVTLPQGQRVTLREIPVNAAAVYVPGGRAPYPSTAVMGVVTARAAGVLDVVVCSPPGRDGQIDPAHPRHLSTAGSRARVPYGRRAGDRCTGRGTETVRRVDVIVGPGNQYVQEAKRQLSGGVGIDGFAGPSDLLVVMGDDADSRLVALDLLAQAEHGRAVWWRLWLSAPASALDAARRGASRGGAIKAPRRRWLCVLVHTTDTREAIEIANAFAPEHLQLMGAEPEALARAGAQRRLSVRRRRERDGLQRLRGRLQPHPPHGGRRALRLGPLREALPPPHVRGAHRPRGRREAREGGCADRPRGGLRVARKVDGGPSARESRVMSTAPSTSAGRTATIERKTGETDVRLALTLDGSGAGKRATGVGFLDHMLDLLARHGKLDLDVTVTGDLQTGAHHTAEDTAIVLGQALDRALGDRAGITRYGAATVPMDEARATCALDISGRPFTLFLADLPPGSTGGFEHELTEEFFRALANAAKLTLHLEVQAGTNAHHMIEAAFKAFARALRQAVAIDPQEQGVPSTKGTLTA